MVFYSNYTQWKARTYNLEIKSYVLYWHPGTPKPKIFLTVIEQIYTNMCALAHEDLFRYQLRFEHF